MLIVSEATNSVFFIPDYFGVTRLKRLFWYLDHPVDNPDAVVASRHFAKRAKYQTVPFEEVDLTGKEDYTKVALVVGPAAALSQVWREHSRVRVKSRPDDLERLKQAGLRNRPDFRTFIENIDKYAEALPDVKYALNILPAALGPDSSFYDKIIRIDRSDELESYLKSRTDVPLPSELPTIDYKLPKIVFPGDIETLHKVAANDYAFVKDVYEFPEKKLVEAAEQYRQSAQSIPVLVRHDVEVNDEFHVVIIIMETPEVVKQFVNYYAAIGAAKIHMYFDNPDDPSIDLVKDHPQVNAIACGEEFWQGKRRKAFEGRQSQVYTHAFNSMKSGWLLAVDADEFVVADTSIVDLFSSMPDDARVVRFDSTEAVWAMDSDASAPFSADFVRHQIATASWRSVEQFKDPNVRNMFRHGLLSHRSGKYAVRVGPGVKRLGTHKASFEDGFNSMHPPKDHPRGKLVHFDAISFSHWKTKFVRRLSKGHGFAGFGPGREQQHDGMRKLDESEYENFHKALYKISDGEKELLANLNGISRLQVFDEMPDWFAEKSA